MRITAQTIFIKALLIVGALFGTQALAETVSVAVASNALGAAKTLSEVFEGETGHEVKVSSGSTGKLYAQIVNGAPYDVFLAANEREPKRLEDAGLSVAGTRFTYALGKLVLWSADGAAIQGDGVALLKAGDFNRLAIANPRNAPYGVASMEVLKAMYVDQQLKRKLVRGENIGQAFQYVASGNAELGFIAMSQLVGASQSIEGSLWMVPSEMYSPVRQQAVLLKRAEHSEAAAAFIEFLQSAPAKEILVQRYGYGVEPALAGM